MRKKALFGVAGNPPNFWESEFRRERANSPEWLKSINLDALEIQCTYGVRMPEKRIKVFRAKAKKNKIELSIHAPYYISLGSKNPEVIKNSLDELHKAFKLAHKIGSRKVIFHPGSAGQSREEARKRAIVALKKFERENKFKGVYLYPEIAGKLGQLGSLEDIIAICEAVKIAYPCLDLAHLHAREQGSLKTKKDFRRVIKFVKKRLGERSLKRLHIHLYPVDFGPRGELSHKAFHDRVPREKQLSFIKKEKIFYPRYEPFLELIVEKGLFPTIICEAKNSQDIGALMMKDYYQSLLML